MNTLQQLSKEKFLLKDLILIGLIEKPVRFKQKSFIFLFVKAY